MLTAAMCSAASVIVSDPELFSESRGLRGAPVDVANTPRGLCLTFQSCCTHGEARGNFTTASQICD